MSHVSVFYYLTKKKLSKYTQFNLFFFRSFICSPFYFFLNDTWEALRLLFRKGSLVFGADCDKLFGRLPCDFVLVDGDDDDDDDDFDADVVNDVFLVNDAVLVGILDAMAVGRVDVFAAVRPALSLSNFRLAGIGDDRSETLLRFANGVTLGDDGLDDELFFGDLLELGVDFFNCSILFLGLSKDCRCRVIIFFSLNSATSALRVRCIITFSLIRSTFKRSN